VKKRYLFLSIHVFIAAVSVLFSACRKINDYTDVGGGLIPPIDNINTFDTSLTVDAYNDIFTSLTDSLRIGKTDEHFLGLINADPVFGATDARLFLQLKPGSYGNFPFARKDSVKIDSVVLVLNYVETFGDTNMAQQAKVYEINRTSNFSSDSTFLVRKENVTYNTGVPLNANGIAHSFTPRYLKDSVKAFRDTTANQLRIKLDTALVGRRLFNYDSSNAYKSDSSFDDKFNGFAVRCEGPGNAIIGINLNSSNTKLAVYYNYPKKGGGGTRDTAVTYFFFLNESASANYVKRDYAGTPVQAAAGLPSPAPIVYLQKAPGTFANLKIPTLPLLGNRVVHKAELIVEQLLIDPVGDSIFPPPASLYLDAYDPSITSAVKYRTIPVANDFNPTSGFDFGTFGIRPVSDKDPAGNKIKSWKFNVTRYVQQVLTGKIPSYDLRLYAPLNIRGKARYAGTTIEFDIVQSLTYVNPSIANGRIRVGGGNHPTQKMRLRIVYSKL